MSKKIAKKKFPGIIIDLTGLYGPAGNAFCILGRCQTGMNDAKVPKDVQEAFQTEATSGDYENLLRTVRAWFRTLED